MKRHYLLLFLFALLTGIQIHAQTDNEIIGDDAAPSITTGDNNTVVGDEAGFSLTSGSRNLLLGYQAGREMFSSSEFIFIGSRAGQNNISTFSGTISIGYQAGQLSTNQAIRNLFIGYEAGLNTTLGDDNVFIGKQAGTNNTEGEDNTFIGEEAGFNNTTGDNNVFIGMQVGQSNTTGTRNTFIGGENLSPSPPSPYNSLSSDASHYSAGELNTTGIYNTYIGAGAGGEGIACNANTFVGYAAGANSELPSETTIVGAFAGIDNGRRDITGRALRNNYFGFAAGENNWDGSDNIVIGHDANFESFGSGASQNMRNVLIGNSTLIDRANDAVGLGHDATLDNDADQSIAIGSEVNVVSKRSIGVGYEADIASSASDAIGIGHQTDVDGQNAIALGAETVASAENSIAIGYQTSATTANSAVIGNSAATSIGGAVNWTATSDGRYKTNVQENVVGLEFINRLRPVTYQYNALQLHQRNRKYSTNISQDLATKSQIRYSGFLAQEVEVAAQMLNYDFSGIDRPSNTNDLYGLRYAEFVVPLVKAAQELIGQVEQQGVEHHDLKAKVNDLDDLEARIMRLEDAHNQSNQ